MRIEETEDDVNGVALTAVLMVAELECELVAHSKECVVDSESAATVYFLAQSGMTATQAGCFMAEQRRVD